LYRDHFYSPIQFYTMHAINNPYTNSSMLMRILFFCCIIFPLGLKAQDHTYHFEHDTLYTSSGYKIFKGQILHFGKGTVRDGGFNFLTVKNGFLSKTLTNRQVVVKEIKKVTSTAMGNGYVDLTGFITLKDNTVEYIVLHMAFDRLIENSPVLPSELLVPDEFRNNRPRNIKRELTDAKNLYEDKLISKAEYKEMKEKLLAAQTNQ